MHSAAALHLKMSLMFMGGGVPPPPPPTPPSLQVESAVQQNAFQQQEPGAMSCSCNWGYRLKSLHKNSYANI